METTISSVGLTICAGTPVGVPEEPFVDSRVIPGP
jgi:hypothetical protein